MKILLRSMLMCTLAALTVGCNSDSSQPPTTAKLTVATSGTLPAGVPLAGIGITMTLPTGVTPALDATGQVDTNRLVIPSGQTGSGGLSTTAIYIEATAGQPARLSLAAASKVKAGFGVGECMQLPLSLAKGASPKASDFVVTEFSAADLNDKAVDGLQATITTVKFE